MRVRLFLVVVTVALCLMALPKPYMPAESQVAASEIDFGALRSQAAAALDALKNSHQSRVASVAAESF
jgi:hypothetical protein